MFVPIGSLLNSPQRSVFSENYTLKANGGSEIRQLSSLKVTCPALSSESLFLKARVVLEAGSAVQQRSAASFETKIIILPPISRQEILLGGGGVVTLIGPGKKFQRINHALERGTIQIRSTSFYEECLRVLQIFFVLHISLT